jgi:tRNA pseudouridine55 synthase
LIQAEYSKRDRERPNQQQRRKSREVKVKIGHGGTLDPLATGVLIAGIGSGTKSLQDFLLCTKTYETVVLFGTSTDSYDRVGKVLRKAPHEHITKEMVEEALGRYRGKFQQLPPLFSALKMNGKPLYEYAREGKPIPREIEKRPVEVLELEMLEWMEGGTHNHKAPTEEAGHAEIIVAKQLWKQEGVLPASKTEGEEVLESFENKKRKLDQNQDDLVLEKPASKRRQASPSQEALSATMSGGLGVEAPETAPKPTSDEETAKPPSKGPPAVRLRMTVTSGFYVRSLCHDLGAAIGSAAIMAELERTRQGDFEVGKNVLEYGDMDKGEEVWGPKVEAMLDEWHDNKYRSRRGEKVELTEKTATKQVATEEVIAKEDVKADSETHVLAESTVEALVDGPVVLKP